MVVKPIKTQPVLADSISIYELLDAALADLHERNIVAITSKIISLCENRTIPISQIDKKQLIHQEADLYYSPEPQKDDYRYHFTIVNNTLVPASGIDESNGNGDYVLWPEDPQKSANQIRHYLMEHFHLKEIGVVITDSTIFPSRWGTLGMAIGYSGFSPVKNYIGLPDLFGRPLKVSKANIAGGLAASAVLVMGEGSEQTPIALFEDVPFVDFYSNDPSLEEIEMYYVSPLKDEPFAPLFNSADWLPGNKNKVRKR